jgi:RNA polymerase sigma-70 factor (ECF subfamily)
MMETVNMPLLHTLDGFERIFRENYSPLFSYINSMTSDEDMAKDVLSDLFLNLWQQKDKLQINDLKPYLFRSAKNGALKALSSRYQISQLPDDAFDIPENTYNPFEKFVAKQSIKIVEELINKLPTHRKEMIELRLLGLKNAEIAHVLDITEKKVEYNMREAIEQLGHAIHNGNFDKATIAGGLMLVNMILTITVI